ncbi:NAD-dependent epimerase/dehydratase family protein [Microbacterium marinilacus]|uniref:NAD-dependent epimerase/dehydratase domain-containing protein n=1 Tax=Microbacterium marinilacus TaxID=415209 RepID=A0ABP7B205_9MICO|nr:NAD-dependent epimerase/dehydratase family protein [Microbacterium marinilacus]MBY0688574.1 NAD-dependent epimerase/dehydratase family protein [Microbacterium marinilacus]
MSDEDGSGRGTAPRRIAIVGATGNVGTALLHALRADDWDGDVLGIARRLPDVSEAPYDRARWERVDLAAPAADERGEERIVARLAAALEGVDTVVHLAWMIQPNRQRELIRRANVEGTRRVAEACLRAGVGHLVCASSVGAYTGVEDDEPRDESWPTGGVPTAHYSVDKAAQERVLDEAEARGLAVARVRPALVFDADAGAEIVRLFIGALLPPALLRPGRLPLLPLPAGLRLQVVHGADLADAYRRVVLQRATGAFNVAGEPVLRGPDLAAVLDHGRHLAVPAGVLRPLVHVAWRAHLIAADAGWLDMAMAAPLLDTSRTRSELGWTPRHGAEETLRELLTAMADGTGAASAPLRPRRTWPQDQLPPGAVEPDALVQPAGPDGAASGSAEADGHRVPARIERDILGLYLSDHLTGSTAGVDRMARMAKAYEDTELGPDLARIARELREERTFLKSLIASLELRRRPYRQAAAWIAEKAGRLKTNGRPLVSPMTPVLEIEVMRSAVIGKLGGWQTLLTLAPDLGLPPGLFEDLADQARVQADTLGRLHAEAVPGAFGPGVVD